jgi:LacI family transcriptional regulator
MAASIKDVAREAGVSIATVSRVLNNIDVVNEDTKKKVEDAIKKLSYRPNIVARSLKTQRTKTLGIILPDIASQIYPEVVRGVEDIANIYDYNIILCNTDLNIEKEKEYLNVLKEKMVDGVVYISSSLEKEVIDTIHDLQMPTVLVETADSENTFASVTIDNIEAANKAVSFLIEKGNKKIAFIGTSSEKINASSMRYEGYKKALEKNRILFDLNIIKFTEGGIRANNGYSAMNDILEKGEKFDALFCSNDELAMGAINALREKGISVPEEIDVMGFDNIYASSVFYPKLTTIAQPLYDMGSVGTRMLIKIINKEELEKQNYVLNYRMIERNSVKK